ncbi:MAG: hypothetical protein CMJ65_07470 [Planctomycetaceae bacterium]|jgi:hypothetical protein|nr:hypothetical protein [Planctomycetaceae bacterium]MDP7274541.1 hypothetical protein [Planctomycetaceae bacterium]
MTDSPTPESRSRPVNRREFARRVAAGTAVVGLAGSESSSAPRPTDKPKTPGSKKPAKPAAEPEPPPPPALLLEMIRQRYPDKRLDDDQILAAIYGELRSHLARSRRLSQSPLENSDEPGFVFSAFRSND